jgi:hypothetical protein
VSCEHCWYVAQLTGMGYSEVVVLAEQAGWSCTKDDLCGRQLRAGQFWDEATQRDSREAGVSGDVPARLAPQESDRGASVQNGETPP